MPGVPEDKLEFRITHDTKDQKIEMDNMTIEVSKALTAILQATTRIVELTPNNKKLRICVKEGSAVVSMQGPVVESVQKQFNQILEKKSSNKELIEEWRSIQTLFSNNGITYEASFRIKNSVTSITESLKSSTQFRSKKISKPPVNTNVVFLSGKLIAVGGKHPNIHIDDKEHNRVTISCTELGANKAKAYLYKDIFVSTWCTKSTDNKYELCDSYAENQVAMYKEFRDFIAALKKAPDEIESLKMIHYKSQEILKQNQFRKYRKFLKLFNTDRNDINVLKTLLIVSRPFADQENIHLIYKEIDEKFRRKFAKLK